MKSPLLSIITINRNNAGGLQKTFNSILSLNFDDFEYIIIDGASTDGSVEIINNFCSNPHIKEKISFWVSESDSGIYNAMNKGLSHAKGYLVCMMNSGDVFFPHALDNLQKLSTENPEAILYGATKRSCNDEFIDVICSNANKLETTGLCHQAVFIPLALHKKHGFYNENYKICADYDFLLKCFLADEKFIFTDSIVCTFDLSGASQSPERLKEKLLIQKKYGVLPKKSNIFKRILKLFVPYGIFLLWKKISA